MNYSQSMNNSYTNNSTFFPQPQGNVYIIGNSLEIANIPIIGNGISVGLCLSEGLLYIKSMQNGSPSFLTYNISPYVQGRGENNNAIETRINKMEQQLDAITKTINASTEKEVKLNELI